MTANRPVRPSLIVSASGMATGGRVLHHLRNLLPDRRNMVLIVGFAAEGTRARDLAEGARTRSRRIGAEDGQATDLSA